MIVYIVLHTDGYVGTPPGVTLAPLNVSDNTSVVDDYSCDPETIFSCTSTPGSTCSSGYLTVTCPQCTYYTLCTHIH